MKFLPSSIPDVVIIEPKVFGDNRGFFMETWRSDQFGDARIGEQFVQENHSRSGKGVLRGLHYQINQAQGKLVRVVQGEVFDVAVDMRRSSVTFGQWVGTHLSAENKKILWVPPGFAHGFLTLSDPTDFVYKCTDYYAPNEERVLMWNDPVLAIEWPIAESETPVQSERDACGLPLSQAECYP